MSVLVSKVVSTLIHPLNLALYGWLFALLLLALGWRRLAWLGAGVATLWLAFWSTPYLAEPILTDWEQRHAPTLAEFAPTADAIVVLGGGVRGAAPPIRPYPDLGDASDRVWTGARLWHAKKAPKLIVTGGRLPWTGKTRDEASGMLDFLSELGVPKDAVLLESDSQTTFENALKTAPMMEQLQAKSAILVTSAFHMERSLRTYQKAMPEVNWIPFATDVQIVPRQPSPIQYLPNAHTLLSSQQYLREQVGIWVYQYQGRL